MITSQSNHFIQGNPPQEGGSERPQVLLIGLDAADWDLLATKIAAGKLPNLARCITRGASGPLRSLHPLFSPSLWATIATGRRSYDHGITGFTLPCPSGRGLRPYDSSSRRLPAFWNILSDAGKTSNIVGWWTTAPAEPIQGVMVDETFKIAHAPLQEPWDAPLQEPWDIPPKSIFPSVLSEKLAPLRVHPQALPEALLRRLVPKLYEIDPSNDLRLSGIAKILAEDLTNLQVALHLMARGSWDLTSVYLSGLDSLSHQGMSYRAPALPGVDQRDQELYGELVDRAYELYDEWVGLLVEAAGDDATVLILSDHGFYHDHRRPQTLGIEATAPCAYHAPTGSLMMAGPLVQQGVAISHATILDICPTLLAFFGISIKGDKQGKVLWNSLNLGEHSVNPSEKCAPTNHQDDLLNLNQRIDYPIAYSLQPTASTTEAALRQLVALGYLPELPSNQQQAIQEASCDQFYHRALSYLEEERIDQALPLLEKARKLFPHRVDVLRALADGCFLEGNIRGAATHWKQFVRLSRRDARRAAQTLMSTSPMIDPSKKLTFSEAWELRRLLVRATLDEELMEFMMGLANWSVYRQLKDRDLLLKIANHRAENSFMGLHAGKVCLSSGLIEEGLALLRRVASWDKEEASALALLAEYENSTAHFSSAESLAREALQRNPLDAASWLALSRALIGQSYWKEAKEAAHHASRSFLRRHEAEELLAGTDPFANEVYEISGLINHHNDFSDLNQRINQPTAYSLQPIASIQPTGRIVTVIVTGLPRSGTSLIMQMLAAGGFSIISDQKRLADRHNPRGYFEHEAIKKCAEDASHFHELLKQQGVVKIVIPLLWELPKDFKGALIFIRRDLQEVIASQHRMAGEIVSAKELEQAYRYYEAKTFEIIRQRGWPCLMLFHADVIADPQNTAIRLNQFLGGSLDKKAMAEAVVPSLHREKVGEIATKIINRDGRDGRDNRG